VSTVAAEAAVVIPSQRSRTVAVEVLPDLWVPEFAQWVSTTSGRIALDGYSWMQAVHWVAGSGLYEPRRHRRHGPRSFSATTVWIAQLLAELSPCRPGIAYLVRRTGLSDRTVEYALAALRETGLLAYVVKGTRVRGQEALASEFVRVVPVEFDAALGIRTVQRDAAAPGYTRAAVGIEEAGRDLMAKLAKKAARRVGKARRKASSKAASKSRSASPPRDAEGPVPGPGRCTPMRGGTSTVSTSGSNALPSESKLASGRRMPSPPKRTQRGPRKLNRIGRRYQLAGELVRRVPWLRSASLPRISWVVGEVADAGWTADEVLACLDSLGQEPPAGVRRPSGLLAARLRGMATMPGWSTPEQRAVQTAHRERTVDSARKHRIQQERSKQERSEGDWQPPVGSGVRREVNAALARAKARQLRERPVVAEVSADDGPFDLEQLSRGEVADLRAAAQSNPGLIESMIAMCGEAYARRLYSNQLVNQVLNPVRSSLVAPYQVWGNA
jgi:DNA-binding transcriptional ArsR family regulator